MAIPVVSPINLLKNELQNARIQNLASAPSSPVAGQVYFDTTDDVLKFYDGASWIDTSGGGISALTGDVSASGSGSVSATVNTVGGASATNIADAVTKRHTQHTDTGTTATSFQLDSGNTGPRAKNNGGTYAIRNAADNADANLSAADIAASGNVVITGNLTVNGTSSTLNVTTVETGDNIILLNSEITTSAGNTSAGVAVKRLHSDNTTRRDVTFQYDESTDRWTADINPSTGSAVTTRTIVQKYTTAIGDGSTTAYVVTHSLNSRDVYVAVRETNSPYAQVFADVVMTSADTVTVTFAVAPTSNQYTVIVIG